jgi:hypothetical protein
MLEFVQAGRSSANLPNISMPNPDVMIELQTGIPGLLEGSVTVDQLLNKMQAAYDLGGTGD